MNKCPNTIVGDLLSGGHRMRLERSDGGDREVWKCVLCGFIRIESLNQRCRSCGGFKHENAPWWCTRKEEHS